MHRKRRKDRVAHRLVLSLTALDGRILIPHTPLVDREIGRARLACVLVHKLAVEVDILLILYETIEKIIRILDPESAKVIKDFFSEERLAGYGVSGEKAQTAREILFILVDKLALHDQAEREEDIEAVKHLFNLLVIASGQNSEGQDDLFGEEGKIGTAHDVVYTLLDSQLGYEVLIEAMTKDGAIIEERRDAFGVHKNFSDSDEELIIGTVSEYLAEHPTRTLEAQALLALLGIEM